MPRPTGCFETIELRKTQESKTIIYFKKTILGEDLYNNHVM